MATTSATRSIEIAAPVPEVFAIVSDPHEFIRVWNAITMFGDSRITDVQTGPDGVIRSTTVSMPVGWGPLTFNVSATIERIEHVPDERIVEQDSLGNLDIDVVEPSGTGTRLTHTSEWSSRIPLLDRLQTLVVTRGKGLGRWLEEYLRLIKQRAEA